MLADFRYAIRSLACQPALTLAVVLTVALAIAANTGLFSIFDGLLFRPLPYRDADRLVAIAYPAGPTMSIEERQQATALLNETPLLAERVWARPTLLFEEGSESVNAWGLRAAQVSPNMFDVLGVSAIEGRVLSEADEGVSSPRPVLLSYELWRSRFGGDPALIGKPIDLPGVVASRRLLLAGVLPPGFGFPQGVNVWVPRVPAPQPPDYARLAPGVAVEQLRAQMPKVSIVPLREQVRPEGAFALGVLLAATGLLLLVAWVQVAALLFSRAAGRAQELGVRLALGATRLRLVRQFTAEGIVVAVAALALAWLLTPALTAAIVRLLPPEMTSGQALAPDARTFAFACALSLAGVLLLSVVPLEIVRQSAPLGLLRGGFFGGIRLGAARVRSGMLVAQLAVTAMLLYMAALALHSYARVNAVDPGFTPQGVVAVQVPAIISAGATPQEMRAGLQRQMRQFEDALEALAAAPGVIAAGGGRAPFVDSQYSPSRQFAVDVAANPGGEPLQVRLNYARGDYLRVLGLRLLEGHAPTEADVRSRGQLAAVNETLARELARFAPVVGQVLAINKQPVTITGVVNDFAEIRRDVRIGPEAIIFRPSTVPWLVARLDGTQPGAAAALQATLQQVWPDRPGREIFVVTEEMRRATADYRSRSVLLGLIALLCLPLAVAGVGGALSYATRQRTREIAIHLALGADPERIRRRVVATALLTAVSGLALGLLAGLGLGRWMSAYLYGVGTADAPSVLAVVCSLGLTAWIAALWPARRAARIEPAAALREM